MNIIGIYEGEKSRLSVQCEVERKSHKYGVPVIMNEGYLKSLEANEHLPEIPLYPFRVLHNRTDVSIRTNHNDA